MRTPADRKYRETHEWLLLENGEAVVGISDHAQEQLGDVTFVDLPVPGRAVKAGQEVGSIESVKAASEIYAPASGVILAVNEALNDTPELINSDPYGEGWIFRMRLDQEPADLLDAEAYEALTAAEAH